MILKVELQLNHLASLFMHIYEYEFFYTPVVCHFVTIINL